MLLRTLLIASILLLPMLGVADPRGEVTVSSPNERGPLLGLPCDKTDLVDGYIAAAGDVAYGFFDLVSLTAGCPGENPGLQLFAYEVFFVPDGWDIAAVWVFLDQEAQVHATGMVAADETDVIVDLDFAPVVDLANGTIRADFGGFVSPPFRDAFLRTHMMDCDGSGCGTADVLTPPTYADRAPDVGYWEVEG